MSWLELFRKRAPRGSQPDSTGFDPELLRRLEALAYANAQVQEGRIESSQVHLCPNVDQNGVVEDQRPTVNFRLNPLERRDDTWTFCGSIDDATGYLRFLMDLQVPKNEASDRKPLDADNLPGLKPAMRRHPESAHGELARSYCLLRWRAEVEVSFLVERVPGPLLADAVVMGAQLTRGPVSYSAPGSGSWLLLKCSDPGPFFIGFDSATGEAEMFPRRFDADGYALALQLLRVIA
jgi:hypothetical protein